jgi:DNA-binding NtrC family response regulator
VSGPRMLIVDDEKSLRDMLQLLFHKQGYEATTAANYTEGVAAAIRLSPDVILCDIKMPDGNGLDLLSRVRSEGLQTPVIMITAHTSTEDAIQALKRGATDYIPKPFNNDELMMIVRRALGEKQLQDENVYLRKELAGKYNFSNIIGRGSRMQEIFRTIDRIGKVSSTVLVTGESGTGKEVIARQIHFASTRKDRKFVSINCGALPETLLESELFGHERGAFTGAVREKRGLFQEADGGTLFLDEISETTPTMQVKLLRAIQEKLIRRVGGNEELPVDVRIIAATNKDLAALVAEGKFREDLFYRLSVVTISLPPLRERREDIPMLAEHFLQAFLAVNDQPPRPISPEAMAVIVSHDWPGNVRELQHAIERAAALSTGSVLGSSDLPPNIAGVATSAAPAPTPRLSLHAAVSAHLRRALKEARWNKKLAAQLLGIHRRTLYRLTKRYGIPLGGRE